MRLDELRGSSAKLCWASGVLRVGKSLHVSPLTAVEKFGGSVCLISLVVPIVPIVQEYKLPKI